MQRAMRVESADDRLPRICALFKDRCDTTVALAQWAAASMHRCRPSPPNASAT
jgi:glutamyl-tRNA synthetase